MTKHRWKSFSSIHIDAEKEEQMKMVKIGKIKPETIQYNWRMWDSGALKPKRLQFKAHLPLQAQCYPQPGYLWYTEWQLIRKIEDQVKKILKLTKNINHGNKERNLRKKSEVIHLIEDFQKQYDALYTMYQDLREEVKKSVGGGDDGDDDDDGASSMDSDTFYSTPKELSSARKIETSSTGKSTSDFEDTILKDKLTCSSEVKTIVHLDSKPREYCGEDNLENTSKNLARIDDLEGEVASLKLEISILCMQRRQLEERVELKCDEAVKLKEKISRMGDESKQNEGRLYSLEKRYGDKEQQYLSRISDLMAQSNDMQIELNTLKHQKIELEEQFSYRVDSLNQEMANVNSEKSKLEMELKRKSESLLQTQVLIKEVTLNLQRICEENEGLKVKVNGLEFDIQSVNVEKQKLHGEISELQKYLSQTKNELSNEHNKFNTYRNSMLVKIQSSEEEIKNINNKLEMLRNDKRRLQMELEENEGLKVKVNSVELGIQSANVQKEKMHREISELQKSLSATKNELSNERNKFNAYQNNASVKIKTSEEEIKNLKNKLEDLRNDTKQLQTELEKEKHESSITKSQLEKISKSNFQIIERKVEEMAEEFRKQLEDKYRILSRRIRVAEQLQVESKEWYRKTKETYEQISNDLKERAEESEIGFKNIKDVTLTANDVLISLDSVALRFEERAANFMNRISKASYELKFMKSENKVRELEKMIKEKEDGMLVMKEEKREAIRQLCVWIDYHRSRSDYYKKILTEINTGRRRSS